MQQAMHDAAACCARGSCDCHRAAFWVAGLPVTVAGHSATWPVSFTQRQWQCLLLARLRVKIDREENQSA